MPVVVADFEDIVGLIVNNRSMEMDVHKIDDFLVNFWTI